MIVLLMSFVLLFSNAARCQSIEQIIDQSGSNSDFSDKTNRAKSNTDKGTTLYSIQAGTFFNENDANTHIIELKSQGVDAYIFQSVNSRGETVYTTRIGKYDSYVTAARDTDRLQKMTTTPLIITYFDSLSPAAAKADAAADRTEEVTASLASASNENSPDSVPADYAYDADSLPTLQALQEKMAAMESEIQKLRDEASVRNQLEITEEEAKAEEEDILEAAGREYTLTREGTIKLSYGLSYGYSGYDAIREGTTIEDVANHTITNSLSVSYGLKDNFSVGSSIPFIYKYNRVGTVDSMDATDFGDLSLSWQFQPLKSTQDLPSIIINGNIGIPVGRNPYEIQVGQELSTASGIYDATFGVSVSQVSDPVIAFSSLSFVYPFAVQSINQKRAEGTLDEVDPGMSIGAAVGLGYALSYKLNLNLSFSYSYGFETTYKYKNAPDQKSGTSTGASLRIGTGYKLSQNQNLNFTVGIPITDTRSFTISMSTPIDFEL